MTYPPNANQPGSQPGTPPENNLVWAILSTILCCLPLGAFAIYKATQVNTLWAQGDYAGAQQASADAKKFSIWAAIAGVVVTVLYVILIFAGVLEIASTGSTY